MVFRFATVQDQHVQWLLRRGRAATPLQRGWFYFLGCLVALLIGALLWSAGARRLLPWVGLGGLAALVGGVLYRRHASDGERIYLRERHLVVELDNGGKKERAEFRREWVRVEPRSGDRSLIEVSGQGRSVRVGRFVRPELRAVLAQEIRMALRQA